MLFGLLQGRGGLICLRACLAHRRLGLRNLSGRGAGDQIGESGPRRAQLRFGDVDAVAGVVHDRLRDISVPQQLFLSSEVIFRLSQRRLGLAHRFFTLLASIYGRAGAEVIQLGLGHSDRSLCGSRRRSIRFHGVARVGIVKFHQDLAQAHALALVYQDAGDRARGARPDFDHRRRLDRARRRDAKHDVAAGHLRRADRVGLGRLTTVLRQHKPGGDQDNDSAGDHPSGLHPCALHQFHQLPPTTGRPIEYRNCSTADCTSNSAWIRDRLADCSAVRAVSTSTMVPAPAW